MRNYINFIKMSFEPIDEDIDSEMIYKSHDNEVFIPYDKIQETIIFKMIYNPNEEKEKKQNIINDNFPNRKFYLEDKKEYNPDAFRILGRKYIKKNKNKCRIIYQNKKYKLRDYFEELEKNYNPEINDIIKLKIILYTDTLDMSQMFYGCYHLTSISECHIDNSDLFLLKETKVKDLINSYNINDNDKNIDTNQKWNNFSFYRKPIIKPCNMPYMFAGCISLISMPDISKWDTSNVSDMLALFFSCSSLKSLPDISNWKIDNVKQMENMFKGCNSLLSFPDISKWDFSNVNSLIWIFPDDCPKKISLPKFPDISLLGGYMYE